MSDKQTFCGAIAIIGLLITLIETTLYSHHFVEITKWFHVEMMNPVGSLILNRYIVGFFCSAICLFVLPFVSHKEMWLLGVIVGFVFLPVLLLIVLLVIFLTIWT